MKQLVIFGFFISFFAFANAQKIAAPAPYGAIPSERQLKWHDLEQYSFIHFSPNTFTNKEWGYGDEPESIFNPTDFDADQIVTSIKAAGLKGVIITAKHHDGFCLWPTRTTDHNISKSPWKNGKGDVVREISEACKRHGLKFGVYLSPWDRNNAKYASAEYVTDVYRMQLTELLTNYGPIFEVWFDGANGGDGYYGGSREMRKIDNSVYYDWPNTWEIVRKLAPDAVMFSDIGPDCRWVGTESGFANDPCRATIDFEPAKPVKNLAPGMEIKNLGSGTKDGKLWIPAEIDYSIRPGWFWHPEENDKVKSAQEILKSYFLSVGLGQSMLINIPPDRRGRLYEKDVQSLKEYGQLMKELFAVNYAKDAMVTASNIRGSSMEFSPSLVLDNNKKTYWATDDQVKTAEIILDLKSNKRFNVVQFRENIALGQRLNDWAIDVWRDGNWVEYAKGTVVGANRLVRGDVIETSKVRIRIIDASAAPCISEVGLFLEPGK
jgi:alpha-L-fucosidase